MLFAYACTLLCCASLAWSSSYQLLVQSNEVAARPERLQLSAVVNDQNPPYDAKIECWELETPFHDYPTIGASLSLATSNLTYVTLPPRSSEGLHHPPHPMFFILLTGTAHVELPGDPISDGLWIVEGVNPVIIAVDMLGTGHNTTYPGDKPTVALQAPFRGNVVPKHRVLGLGPCPSSARS